MKIDIEKLDALAKGCWHIDMNKNGVYLSVWVELPEFPFEWRIRRRVKSEDYYDLEAVAVRLFRTLEEEQERKNV